MSERNKFHRSAEKVTRGVHANSALAEAIKGKNAFGCGEDTIERIEIHGIIINGLQEGKTKEEIISILSSDRYENRYEKYSMYFENWIEDAIRKNQMQKEKEEKQK